MDARATAAVSILLQASGHSGKAGSLGHTATSVSKNRVSSFAVMIADFCNKICHKATLLLTFKPMSGPTRQDAP